MGRNERMRGVGGGGLGGAARWLALAVAGWLVAGPAVTVWGAEPATSGGPPAESLERTRKQVRMLDDIYKGAIVTITDNYVNDRETIPAGTAFKKIFKAVEEKGWHTVRLVDATGEPYESENVAVDDFDKRAIRELLAGKPWVEAVEQLDGKPQLRVATPIPVVMDKCVMCHSNYASVAKGQAIGALIYRVPIE